MLCKLAQLILTFQTLAREFLRLNHVNTRLDRILRKNGTGFAKHSNLIQYQ